MSVSGKQTKIYSKIIVYTLLVIGSFFCLIPLLWMFRSSLMTSSQIFEIPPKWIPSPFKWENYKEALTILPFGRYFINSLVIVVLVVTGTVFTSSLCAYGLSRIKWKGREVVFALVISSMMLPYAVTLIPTFVGWKIIGISNSIIPLVAPAWLGGGAFYIFLLRQFYMGIPYSLDESARIEGASHFQVLTKIMIPNTKPAMIVVGLFTFLNTWNDFLGPLVYLNDEKKYTLALGLQLFTGLYKAEWHLMMAAACVVLAPVIIVFLMGQKYFIEGITMTGIKG